MIVIPHKLCSKLFFLTIIIFQIVPHLSHASKPNLVDQSLDSILNWMYANVEIDTTYAHQIGLMGLNKAYEKKDQLAIGNFHDIIAYWHDYHQKFHSTDSVVYHYEKSLTAYRLTDSLSYVMDAQLDLATAYMNDDQYEKARKLTFKTVETLEKGNNRSQLAGAYNSLANLHLLTDEPKSCIEYATKSVNEFETLGTYIEQVNSSMALIYCLCEDEQYEVAHAVGEKNIALTEEHFPSQLGYIVRSLDRMSEASLRLGKHQRALEEAKKMWEIAQNAVGEVQAASHKYMVGKVHFTKGDYQQALDVYEFITKHTQINNDQWEMYSEMAICYDKLGRHAKAYESHLLAFNLRDQVLNDKFAKLKSESFEKYETGKKDQALASQQMELQQKTRIQNLSYGIGGLLLFILAGLAYSFRRNQRFTAALIEKNNENELLLKEIHHRVKNNLETVSALLTLQGEQVDDVHAKSAMLASQNRVEAMGLLHQKLYQGTNLGSIEMKDYFVKLSEAVLESFDKEDKVNIELVMKQLELDIDTAVPIGLIVNELLTNALKYAFPPEYDAKIKIKLEEIDQHQLLLEVVDNGKGFIEASQSSGTGFGTQLVNLLTKQLDGKVERQTQDGTRISMTLMKAKAA